MKSDIHPDYREVVFQDMTSDFKFLTRSTLSSKETILCMGSAPEAAAAGASGRESTRVETKGEGKEPSSDRESTRGGVVSLLGKTIFTERGRHSLQNQRPSGGEVRGGSVHVR